MISLSCTHCEKVLTIDEAFAGGVCRCQHCGTIQTVPSHLRTGTKTPSGPAARTLYKHPVRGDSHVGTGLQNLQDEETATTPRDRSLRAAAPGELPKPAPIRPWTLWTAVGGVIVLGILLIWWMLAHSAPRISGPL